MTATNFPSLLFICRHSAWSSRAAACMETLLTAGIFDLDAALLMQDDAVLQLLPDQDGSALGLKTVAQQLPALELYGISRIYADSASLSARGLAVTDSVLPVTPLDRTQLRALISGSRQILVF